MNPLTGEEDPEIKEYLLLSAADDDDEDDDALPVAVAERRRVVEGTRSAFPSRSPQAAAADPSHSRTRSQGV